MRRSLSQVSKLATDGVSTYSCPACQYRVRRDVLNTSSLGQPSQHTTVVSSTNLNPRPYSRCYRISSKLNATPLEGSVNPNDAKSNSGSNANPQLSGRSTMYNSKSRIRESLREWGIRNQIRTKQNAPQTIKAEGRIRLLPNAIFTGNGDQNRDAQNHSKRSIVGDADADISDIGSSLIQPGTLLWFRGTGQSARYAVYVANMGIQTLLALESGSWAVDDILSFRKCTFDDRRLRIPGFLSPKELQVLRQYMPKSNIARPIAGGGAFSEVSMKGLMPPELIEDFSAKIHAFRHDVDDYMRQFAETYEEGYARVASEHEYRSMTIHEFLSEGFNIDWETTTSSEKMAITHHLAEQDTVTTYQTAEDISVLVMSRTMRKNFETVVEWARQYQDAASQAALGNDVAALLGDNPLSAFIEKARRLILISRKTRSPTVTGGLGPSPLTIQTSDEKPEKVPTGTEFTKTDQMFVDFIWTMCMRLPSGLPCGSLKLMPVTSLILRAVGAYPDLLLHHAIARMFLKEIGAIDPWAPRSIDLALPLHSGKASQKTDLLHHEIEAYHAHLQNVIENGKLTEMDSMAHLRKEWTLPAYAIDREESSIYEDALSIEPAEEVEGGYWVHVHITHISAWFEPESIIGRYARNQGGSFVSVDMSVKSHMLPALLTNHFTLKNGSPVITVSTLIGADGSSLDVKMTPGTLTNLVQISRSAVHELLNIQDGSDEELSVLEVGKGPRQMPYGPTEQDMTTAIKHKANLEKLSTVLQWRRHRRAEELPGNINIPYYNFESIVQTTVADELNSKREQSSYHWRGDPGITLSARPTIKRETELRRAAEPVAQAMRLAAESAARWLSTRNVPAIFMGTEAVSDNSFEQIANRKRSERFLMPLYMRKSAPVPFWNYHLKSFCSCTSPLRRYIDLLALWQVDSYLKAEALGTFEPASAVQDQSLLSFTKGQIDEYLHVDAHVTDTSDHTLRRIKETYAFQALFRAFHFKEATLPSQWEVLIREPIKLGANLQEKNAVGILIPFGHTCEILPDSSGWAKKAQVGQFLPVAIKAVDPELLKVRCTAVGEPSNVQTNTQKFEAVSQERSSAKL